MNKGKALKMKDLVLIYKILMMKNRFFILLNNIFIIQEVIQTLFK